jgi:ABC-type bacteriocin/lantibiotic exporter with double-glycine peptidase domain
MDRESICWRSRVGLGLCGGGTDMVLTLPDTRQRSDHDCADAAGQCVVEYWGLTKRFPALATTTDGTDPRTLEAGFRKLGLRVLSGEASIADLRVWTSAGRPVVCLIHEASEPDSHWVVVAGVSYRKVHFQDPADGPRIMPAAEFDAVWKASGRLESYRRWSIVAYPGDK